MARKTIEPNISYDEQRRLYYVYLDQGCDAAGKRIRGYKTFPTLAAARRTLRVFHAERIAGNLVPPVNLTLRQWLDYWLEEMIAHTRAATTLYGYRQIIQNHLTPALGHIQLQKLCPADIQRYYHFLLSTKALSPNTVRRHHDLLSAALHAAVRLELLARCPTERVEPPKVIPPEIGFYGPEELKQLYTLVRGTRLELIVRMAGSLGLRREEICGLHWSSVDFLQRKIHICQARTSAGAHIIEKGTKNRSSTRVLHMDDDLFQLLQAEALRQSQSLTDEQRRAGLVIVDRTGQPMSPNAVSLAFTRFIRKHNLPKLTLHGMRHTFATLASAQGAPLFDIGQALGHASPATTGRIYTHLLDKTHADTLQRVAAALE